MSKDGYREPGFYTDFIIQLSERILCKIIETILCGYVAYLTSGGASFQRGLRANSTGGRLRSGVGSPSKSPEPSTPGVTRSTENQKFWITS